MPLTLANGTVKHARHGFFFYGDPPEFEDETTHYMWNLRCADPGVRAQYEDLLKAELKKKYDLQEVVLAHVHNKGEMQAAAASKATGKIWDVAGWVGHAVGDRGRQALGAVLVDGASPDKNVITVDAFADIIKKYVSNTPREIIIVGCDAAEKGGFAERISKRFPEALVLGGSGTNNVNVKFKAHEVPRYVYLTGDVWRFQDGEEIVTDEVVLRRAKLALAVGNGTTDPPMLHRCDLTITVKNRVVIVKGTVPSDEARDRVTTLAGVKGAKGVEVSAPIPGEYEDITGGGAP